MHTIRRAVVSAGCMGLLLLYSTKAFAQTSLHTTLRTPAQGELVDGVPPYSSPASSNEGVLLEMANRAHVIFVGTVTAVKKPSDDLLRGGSAGAAVEVDFQVERSVRGVAAGSVYAMREWAGMWRDNPRFVPGQRLLMLLHAPGPGGLSSPVDGLDGAVPIRGGGLPTTAVVSSRNTRPEVENPAAGEQVDMRWLQAKTLRTMSYADAPVASPGVTPVDPTAAPAASLTTQTTAQSVDGEDAGSEPLSRVLGLLGAVQALNVASLHDGRSVSN